MEQLIAELTASGFARDRFGYTTRLRFTELLNQVNTPEIAENIKFKTAALVCQSAEEQHKFYSVFDSLTARLRAENITKPAQPTKPKVDEPAITDPADLPNEPAEPPPPPKMPEGGPQPKLVKTVRKGPITIELNFRDDGYRPWNLPGMEEIVRPLREKEPTGVEEWDVPATIRQTIRNGGMLKLMSHRRRRAPQYLFLIEEKGARDHQAGFFADLAIELTRRDLDAEYYFYDHTPTQCWKDRRVPATYTHLDRLRVEYPFARLILVGDATAFLALTRKADSAEKKSLARRQLYPSALAFHLKEDWELLALMNTRATAIWDEAEETLHSLFPLVPANLKGFGSLMKQWTNRRFLTPHYWKIEHREPNPPALQRFNLTHDQMEEALSELNFYLGSQGFTWLSAISVYPELYWQLTKMLHDEAISENDVPEESLRIQLWHYYLQRLVRLGWLQHGYIPEEFRKILRDKLPPANAADVRRQLLEILQLEENKAPEGSYAEKDQAYTLALFDHERVIALEQPDEIRRKAMEEKLRENVGAQGINISDIEDAVGRNLFERLPEVQAETTKNYWVLWVDDNPSNNQSFQEEVSKEEAIRFVNATSTTHALTVLEGQKFDLIISDVSRHGDKDAGIKMMDKFREAGVKTPVIFFTHPNYVSSSRELLLSKGAVEVVSGFPQLKPIFWEEIAKKRSENEQNLLKISFLERALTASKAVCRVVLSNGTLGTGFLVEGNYLFTCNHILNNLETAGEAKIEFNHEINAQGETQQAVEYRLDVSDFMTSPTSDLDFTRVKVIDREDAPLSQWGVIELEPANLPVENESVVLIRHHLGEPKSMDMSETVGAQGQYFYYADQAEKSPGSAGGPILNAWMKAVAIHHARQDNKEVLGKTRTVREGVLMRDILKFMEANIPKKPEEDLLNQAASILDLGREKLKDGDLTAAYELFQKAQALYAEAQYPAGSAETLHEIGKLAIQMGNLELADSSLQSALSLYQSLQFESSQAFVLTDLGRLKTQTGDLDAAEKHYLEAQDLLEGLYGDTEAEQAENRQALEQIRGMKSGSQEPAETAPMQTQFKTQFFEAYQAGKLEEALDVLRKVFYGVNQEAENQTIQTQARYAQLKREWNEGLVSYADYLNVRDRISRAEVEIAVEFLGLPQRSTGKSPNANEIKTLLANGELKAALIRLNDDIPAAYQADALWLMCRHELLQRDDAMGILTRENFQLAQTKIMQEVLNIVDSTSKTQPKDQEDLSPEQLEQWFQDDKLKEIFTYILSKNPQDDNIILALRQLNEQEKQYRLGLISQADWQRQRTILRHTVRTLSEELGLKKPLLPFEFDGFVFVKTPDLDFLNGKLSGKEDVVVRISRQKSDLAVGENIHDRIQSIRLTETMDVDLLADSDLIVVRHRSKIQDIPPTGVAEWKFGLTNVTGKPLQSLKIDIKLTKYDPDGRPAQSILSSVNIRMGESFEPKSTEAKPAAEKAAAPKLSRAEIFAKARAKRITKATSKRPPPKKK